MDMGKRFIRLKELKPNLNKIYTPSYGYLKSRERLIYNEVYTVRTDSDGNQISPWGAASDQRIYLLGGSSVESIYVKSTLRPHSVLEKTVLENGFSCSVYNLGVSGAQTLNIVNLIVNKLGDKKGSKVVVSIPSNDSSTLNLRDSYYSDDWRYASIVPATNKEPLLTKAVNYDSFKKNIEMIIALCNILELQLYMTSIIYTGENKSYEKLNKIVSDICLSKNIPFIDFEPVFKKSSNYFYDDLHFLPSGSQYYAESIFDAIKSNLKRTNSTIIGKSDICENTTLTNKVVWSEGFKVLNNSIVKVIIDAEFPIDSKSKQALLSVDYGNYDVQSELPISDNSEIGYFKYISAPAGKRIELLLDLKIPDGCNDMRIGLRGWKSHEVKVVKAFVSVVNA